MLFPVLMIYWVSKEASIPEIPVPTSPTTTSISSYHMVDVSFMSERGKILNKTYEKVKPVLMYDITPIKFPENIQITRMVVLLQKLWSALRITSWFATNLIGDIVSCPNNLWVNSDVLEVTADLLSHRLFLNIGTELMRRQLSSGSANIVYKSSSISADVKRILRAYVIHFATGSAIDMKFRNLKGLLGNLDRHRASEPVSVSIRNTGHVIVSKSGPVLTNGAAG